MYLCEINHALTLIHVIMYEYISNFVYVTYMCVGVRVRVLKFFDECMYLNMVQRKIREIRASGYTLFGKKLQKDEVHDRSIE